MFVLVVAIKPSPDNSDFVFVAGQELLTCHHGQINNDSVGSRREQEDQQGTDCPFHVGKPPTRLHWRVVSSSRKLLGFFPIPAESARRGLLAYPRPTIWNGTPVFVKKAERNSAAAPPMRQTRITLAPHQNKPISEAA